MIGNVPQILDNLTSGLGLIEKKDFSRRLEVCLKFVGLKVQFFQTSLLNLCFWGVRFFVGG